MLEPTPSQVDAKQQIVDEILTDLPSQAAVEVNLPSENKVYTLEDPSSPVTLRPMTFEDEKNILGTNKNQDPVNIILQQCTTNINISQLLTIDKLYLLMKLREISYGDDYNVLLLCTHCRAENPTVIKLSQLKIIPVPEDFTDPVTITLPSINKEAKVSLPRVKDEKLFADPKEAYSQLWRFVVEIDGHRDKTVVGEVLKKLPIKDTRVILNAMKTNFGIETRIKFACNTCKEASVVDLPIDANFFDAS